MYDQIASNKRKSALLVFVFTLLVLALGWILGEYYGNGFGMSGLAIAAIVSLIMTLTSYFKGGAVALHASGAREIQKTDHPYVYRMVENLAITAGLPTPRVYIINDPAINAFATGRNPSHASIAVTTGAIESLENEELEGVLAHELSHIKNYDIRIMTMVIVLVGIVTLLSDWIFRSRFFGGRGNHGRGNNIVAILAIIAMILSPLIAQLIKLALSRKREYLADASGVLLTRYPEGLARALEKIAAHATPLRRANHATAHLFIASPFNNSLKKQTTNLFSTHPRIEDRVKTLRAMGR